MLENAGHKMLNRLAIKSIDPPHLSRLFCTAWNIGELLDYLAVSRETSARESENSNAN